VGVVVRHVSHHEVSHDQANVTGTSARAVDSEPLGRRRSGGVWRRRASRRIAAPVTAVAGKVVAVPAGSAAAGSTPTSARISGIATEAGCRAFPVSR